MEKKVYLKDLVEFGSNTRKQITSKVRVSDQGVYPIGEIWDANTVIDVIVNGAHEQHDTLRELDQLAHNLQNELSAAKIRITNLEAVVANRYTKQEIDEMVGVLKVVDEYAIYQFESFDPETGVKWAEGKAQLTGVRNGIYSEVVVIENTVEDFIDQKFFIDSTVDPDGETKYPLYNGDRELIGINVTIFKLTDTTYKDATIKEYVDSIAFGLNGTMYTGEIPHNAVDSLSIANGSIKLEDLSDEVIDKMRAVVDEDDESVNFPG